MVLKCTILVVPVFSSAKMLIKQKHKTNKTKTNKKTLHHRFSSIWSLMISKPDSHGGDLYDVSALQAQTEGRVHIFLKDNALCCPVNSTDSTFKDHPC